MTEQDEWVPFPMAHLQGREMVAEWLRALAALEEHADSGDNGWADAVHDHCYGGDE